MTRSSRSRDPRRHRRRCPLGAALVVAPAERFANGCTAMTGVEAVSNGVPAFRPPEAKNAAATLVTMAALAITMFLGITVLAHAYRVMPTVESGVSQLARAIFGGHTFLLLPSCRPRPPHSCLAPTPRMPTFRAWRRSCRATGICRASS